MHCVIPNGTQWDQNLARGFRNVPQCVSETRREVAPAFLPIPKALGKGVSPLRSSLHDADPDAKASLPSFSPAQLQP